MRLRTITISILAIGLLAGSSVGAVAQDEAAASDVSYFTWDTAGPPEFLEDPATGLPLVTVQIEATDERAGGTASTIEDGIVSAGRLVNDGGSWVGMGRGVNAEDPDAGTGGRAWFTEYTGQDGYEGLTMYTFRVGTVGEPPESIGFIVSDGLVPPFPEPPAE